MHNFHSGYSACPHCGQIDKVDKVSSVVSSGSTNGTYNGSNFGFGSGPGQGMTQMQWSSFGFTQSQTGLSQRLSPPKAPHYYNPWLWMLIFILLATLIFFTVCPLSLLVNSYSCVTVVLVVLAGIGVALYNWCKNETPKRQAKYHAEMATYNRMLAKWNNLYYCQRDDGVFLPGPAAQLIPTNYMMNFLSQP